MSRMDRPGHASLRRSARLGVRRRWRAALQKLVLALAPSMVFVVLRLLDWTLRVDFEGLDSVRERWHRGEPVILTFWHGRLLAMALGARILGIRVCILVSQHRDGELATRVLHRWGVETVRGSATRGAVAGFLGLKKAVAGGANLAVVPDGPRGPRHVAKPGVVHLARATGADVVPVSFAAERAWRLGSWDQMVIPKPFSRLVISAGEAVTVPADADADALEQLRRRLEDDLIQLTDGAEGRFAT